MTTKDMAVLAMARRVTKRLPKKYRPASYDAWVDGVGVVADLAVRVGWAREAMALASLFRDAEGLAGFAYNQAMMAALAIMRGKTVAAIVYEWQAKDMARRCSAADKEE